MDSNSMEAMPRVLDVVALLKNLPEKKLSKGQVGTIVEQLDENVFEVEFVDTQTGDTIAWETVNNKDLILLHFQLEQI
jgi:plastocyanin